jgi:uncharacterized protein YndB with AHSA1/START domain
MARHPKSPAVPDVPEVPTLGPDEVLHASFTLERRYDAPVARVFRAFSDPATKRRWFAEGEGFQVQDYALDFRVGGNEVTRFSTEHGMFIRNDTSFLDIVKEARIVIAYSMSMDDRPFSASLATFQFLGEGEGTLLRMTEQGAWFQGGDGPALREWGTRSLLDALGRELERESAEELGRNPGREPTRGQVVT